MKQLSQIVSKELQTKDHVGCKVEEKAHLLKSTKSVGVARQYDGTSGKVDNCQVGVYLNSCTGK
jgi:SRSO17 transposase